MAAKYDILKQVIDLWSEYEEKHTNLTLLDFAEWMTSRIREEPALNRKSAEKTHPDTSTEQLVHFKGMDEKARFMEYMARITRLQEFYIRKFMDELPLNSRLEFMFLYSASHIDRARKTDLINIHLVEYTTGMDTIRRLINNGLLEEKLDDADKRVRLLVLTDHGKSIIRKAEKRISDERNMFLACISENKWKKIVPVLEEINDFHSSIYLNYGDKPYPELLNLMDSLKHLYK